MSMPEGFAVMLSVAPADELVVGALVEVVVAGELVVVATGGLAAVDVDFELELPHATIASAHTGTVSSVGSFLIALLSGVEGSDVLRRALFWCYAGRRWKKVSHCAQLPDVVDDLLRGEVRRVLGHHLAAHADPVDDCRGEI
jgi:hypothetical protein